MPPGSNRPGSSDLHLGLGLAFARAVSPHVLVVDDDSSLAENLASIARLLPAEVEVAATGRVALELAALQPFDLALVDIQLPDMSGTALISPLRVHSAHGQVVLITGDGSVDTAAAAVGMGAFAYVVKPFDSEQLIQLSRRALEAADDARSRSDEQSRIRRSERIHRHVVEGLPAPTVAFDPSRRITVWNRRLEQITGFSRDEVVGSPVDGFVSPEILSRLPVKEGGEVVMRWEHAEFDIPDEGRWTCVVGNDLDHADESFRQIVRAERLAAITPVSRGLSHEIRNPLNSARLQLAALERRVARGAAAWKDVTTATRIVDAEIERIDRMLSQFLVYIAPRELDKESLSLLHLVRQTVECLQLEIPVKIALAIEAGEDLPAVVADGVALAEALRHLIRNSIESLGNEGRLTIRLRSVGSRVEMDVEDTGVGFPDGAPIFDAFFSTKELGIGLGLSIVHRIVDDHRGTVSVRTRPGLTCFTISLPS